MNITYTSCELCPRMCRVDRTRTTGYCGCGSTVRAARAALHPWEEPCISGTGSPAGDGRKGSQTDRSAGSCAAGGSGTVFFSGCTLRCCFCQNFKISCEGFGKDISARELSDIFLRLQDQGAHNINLVTATQYLPSVLEALDAVRHRLTIPVVYNCGGYERVETVMALNDYVDIWLPDLKYHSPELSARYSNAGDYFSVASAAIRQMIAQTGAPVFAGDDASAGRDTYGRDACGRDTYGRDAAAPGGDGAPALMRSGVIIRHMVLPGAREDSVRLLHWMKDSLPADSFLVSLMSQYTPFYRSSEYPEINRRITSYEYEKVVDAAIGLGLVQGYMQEKSSAKEEYTPPFDLEGME